MFSIHCSIHHVGFTCCAFSQRHNCDVHPRSAGELSASVLCWLWQVNDFLSFEVCSTAFFTLEYFVRLWSASVESKYRGWRGRLRWARQPLQVIDLVCLFAFYIDVLDIERLAPRHWKLSVSLAVF